jgi:hypothetical protein
VFKSEASLSGSTRITPLGVYRRDFEISYLF